MGSLWNCPMGHAFETIGSVGEDCHAELFGPAMVLQCRFHVFPSTGRVLGHPGEMAAEMPVSLDSTCNHVVLAQLTTRIRPNIRSINGDG